MPVVILVALILSTVQAPTGASARPAESPAARWIVAPRPEMPVAALRGNIGSGTVVLNCEILDSGEVVGCVIVSEAPAGYRLGRSAITAMRAAQAEPDRPGRYEAILNFIVQ